MKQCLIKLAFSFAKNLLSPSLLYPHPIILTVMFQQNNMYFSYAGGRGGGFMQGGDWQSFVCSFEDSNRSNFYVF